MYDKQNSELQMWWTASQFGLIVARFQTRRSLLLLLLLLHAKIRVTLSHKNVAGAPYRIIVNAANSPQWLMSVAKGVTE